MKITPYSLFLTLSLSVAFVGLKAQTIVIDPGHGKNSNCSNCQRPDGEVLTVMAVSEMLEDSIQQNCGWTVFKTRDDGQCICPSLSQRENMSNSWGADRFLSIHANAGGGTGTETFWCTQSISRDGDAAAFSAEVQARMAQYGQWTSRRTIEDANYLGFHLGVLNNNNAIGCLNEIGFFDRSSDLAKLENPAWQARFAQAYFVALQNNMNLNCAGAPTASNNICTGATPITSNQSCVETQATISGYSASGFSKPSCDGFGSPALKDAWFKFQAVSTSHTITVGSSSSFDAVAALYSGCSSGAEIRCADDLGPGGDETIIATALSIGNTYYLRVYDYGSIDPSTPQFSVCVTHSGAISLPDLDITAAQQSPFTLVAGEDLTIDYTIDNVDNGSVSATTQTGYYLVPITQSCPLTIPTGATVNGGQLTVAEMADGTETESHTFTIPASTAPNDYHLVIATDHTNVLDESNENNNTYCLSLTVSQPITNGTCSSAQLVGSATTCNPVSASILGASPSGMAKPTCDAFGNPALKDLWYSFNAVSPEHTIELIGSTTFDAVIALYSGCAAANQIACADNGSSGVPETITTSNLTVGNTYYIRVYDYGSIDPVNPAFDLCVTHAAGAELSVSISGINHLSCFEGSNGSLTIDASGGTPPYAYQWSTGATTSAIGQLTAGVYSITVTDNTGATATTSGTVNQPDGLAVSATRTNESAPGALDGAIDLNVSGGTPVYSYFWSNSETTQDLSGLSAGSYGVTIFDQNNCTKSATYTLTTAAANCPVAVNLTTATISSTRALLTWELPAGLVIEGMEIRGRVRGTSGWATIAVSGNVRSKFVRGLIPGQTYEWKCRTWCALPGNKSDWSAVQVYTSPPASKRAEDDITAFSESMIVYPNPVRDDLYVHFEAGFLPETLQVFSSDGKLLQEIEPDQSSLKLNLSSFSGGTYLLKAQFGEHSEMQRILKVD